MKNHGVLLICEGVEKNTVDVFVSSHLSNEARHTMVLAALSGAMLPAISSKSFPTAGRVMRERGCREAGPRKIKISFCCARILAGLPVDFGGEVKEISRDCCLALAQQINEWKNYFGAQQAVVIAEDKCPY